MNPHSFSPLTPGLSRLVPVILSMGARLGFAQGRRFSFLAGLRPLRPLPNDQR